MGNGEWAIVNGFTKVPSWPIGYKFSAKKFINANSFLDQLLKAGEWVHESYQAD